MNGGLKNGFQSGIKSGFIHSTMKSGMKQGIKGNNIQNKLPMTAPDQLVGNKLPWIYMNADYVVNEGTYTTCIDTLDLPNKWVKYGGITSTSQHPYLLNQDITGTWFYDGSSYDKTGISIAMGSNSSSVNRPYPKDGRLENLGRHTYLDFGGVNGNDTNNWLAVISGPGAGDYTKLNLCKINGVATNAITIMMVLRSKMNASKVYYWQEGTTTPGGIKVVTGSNTNRVQSELYGYLSGNIKSSKYESPDMGNEISDWFLYTGKFILKDNYDGIGNEQETYINGRMVHSLVSNTWVVPETTTTFPVNQEMALGSSSTLSPVSNAMDLASFIMLPYWANDMEARRLENY